MTATLSHPLPDVNMVTKVQALPTPPHTPPPQMDPPAQDTVPELKQVYISSFFDEPGGVSPYCVFLYNNESCMYKKKIPKKEKYKIGTHEWFSSHWDIRIAF
jgi:hypothetical protein